MERVKCSPFKKGDKSFTSNYRPISLFSNIGKLQERIVFNNIYNHLRDNRLLYKYQSDFLPNHSTTYQLIDIYNHICKSFDDDQFSCMVFCDVSKAFDRVWHKGLVFKLKQHEISGSLLDWITDCLSNRSQPLLFLIYVNEFAESLLSLTRLFADDSSLFCSASSTADLQGIINHDLQILSAWAKQWLISFNALKTEAILFTLKHFNNCPTQFLMVFQLNLSQITNI